ncbi:enoyl-CoA hydratase/isomerase family protein [Sporichthya polymorpha]|uniref:enoyl-CoA hydratase/isomerase family protein n=1 Tax=Sporichthya polymorpha TaxID=35751 RepID=UPI000366FA84|nr:enoyl-CoA hydratase-related protein [Sporichthya polymorpha]
MTENKRVDLETLYHERPAPGVGLVTLNRPERGNGVVVELVRDLFEVLDAWEPDPSVRVVVLTGAGKQFSAGADLVAMREYLLHELPVRNEPFNARALFPLTQRLLASRLVFVAAINGGATAGGLDFALACDLRIASTAAKLGETYINMGLAPGNGGSWLLPKLVGSGVAAELALTGDVINASRALELGLVSRVVEPEQLLPTALELAARIANKPWRALEATKQALRASWTQDFATAMNTSYQVTDALHRQPDLLEAVEAFLEKRAPRFNQGFGE